MRGIVATVALLLGPASAAGAAEISVAELIEEQGRFAGDTVTLRGELVGDYGFRGDGWMWTQLNDDPYVDAPIRGRGVPAGGNVGIGLKVPVGLTLDLDPPGGYLVRGPIVVVTGIWKYHDPERQGESYLDVRHIEVVERGRRFEEGLDWVPVLTGVGLLLAAALVAVLTRPRD